MRSQMAEKDGRFAGAGSQHASIKALYDVGIEDGTGGRLSVITLKYTCKQA